MFSRILTQVTHINCLCISTQIRTRVSYRLLCFPFISAVPQLFPSLLFASFLILSKNSPWSSVLKLLLAVSC
ncbi:unnamed protein product [Hymenolepis diminuta]|uniref:Uncharacterized protein n=1 Tax=Hymenolepis diminuta TaxID=6216 RepID=A0A564Z8S8_HYMDI|nr:unnamed protein product [Hymenolepis diminuta]